MNKLILLIILSLIFDQIQTYTPERHPCETSDASQDACQLRLSIEKGDIKQVQKILGKGMIGSKVFRESILIAQAIKNKSIADQEKYSQIINLLLEHAPKEIAQEEKQNLFDSSDIQT